ncbi:MAG: hypothetical protein ISP24_02055 [Rickettsiales bacterium]|nr:hypothetical protein [Rickettsiales bacterium]
MVALPDWPKFKGNSDIDLRLSRVNKFLSLIGNPHHKLNNIIHVAGTNGKGSTISFLRSFIESSGKTVNIYTSPHLIEFNERIRIKGEIISDAYLNKISNECLKIEKEHNIELTFFEGATILAIKAFTENIADYNLIEVGLGGRFDATNVFSNKLASVITNISFDHQEFLGNDLLSIAGEKFGIVQDNEKVFIGRQVSEVANFYKNKTKNAYFYDEFSDEISVPLNIGLPGEHQKENYKLAAFIYKKLISARIADNFVDYLYWPGRLQNITKLLNFKNDIQIYLDGGHNESAALMILEFVKDNNIKNILISKSISKNIYIFTDILTLSNVNLFFTEMEFSDSYKISDLDEEVKSKFKKTYNNVDQALSELKNLKDNLLICGSLFLVGEILSRYNYKLS